MKNPHGLEPTRFMKREESDCAIDGDIQFGPIFGESDIVIGDLCNVENRCHIGNDGDGYECHPEFKSSLFVKTAKPDKTKRFSVMDYEVYTHN